MTKRVLLNALLFQFGWWAVALSASRGHQWIGFAAVAVVVTAFVAMSRNRRASLRLLATVTAIGFAVDGLQGVAGVFAPIVGASSSPFVLPAWLAAMWANFATTLTVSLGWLRGRPLAAALFGAIGGPASYYAGSRFGLLAFGEPLAAMLVVNCAIWAVATPLLVELAARIAPETDPG